MTTQDLAIPGFTIAYRTWGKPSNPPILALHGWLDNANSFAPLAEYLQEKYYLIAVDLPGHGLSSHLAEGCNYHFIDGVFSIVHIIHALKLEKVHLLGHSMGACLASLVGGAAPSLIRSMALIEGLGPFSAPDETACSQIQAFLKSSQSKARKPKAYSLSDAAKARAAKGYVSLGIAKTLSERGLKQSEDLYHWSHDRRLVVPSPLYLTEEQILSFLRAITAKCCLIWASQGFSFNSTLMQGRIHSVSDLEVFHIEGGHHVHMEQPEILGKLLEEFFDG